VTVAQPPRLRKSAGRQRQSRDGYPCRRGCHVFPDAVTTGGGEDPQWLYSVVFEGRELWGDAADVLLKVSIEAFEPYLVAI
jgi:hypothetical protein